MCIKSNCGHIANLLHLAINQTSDGVHGACKDQRGEDGKQQHVYQRRESAVRGDPAREYHQLWVQRGIQQNDGSEVRGDGPQGREGELYLRWSRAAQEHEHPGRELRKREL